MPAAAADEGGFSAGDVAVVVPIYRERYSEDERTSVRHLERYLGAYDRIAISPRSLARREAWEGDERRFPDADFASRAAYSRLLLSPRFYEQFRRYRYILIYQLDALVFSDQLREWCAKGYDYVGAPWPQPPEIPAERQWYSGPLRCGNGGFSLRSVGAHLRVLRAARRPVPCARILVEELRRSRSPLGGLRGAARSSPLLFRRNEDVFWSFHASRWDPTFSISPPDEGLRFSFELNPSWCFEQNGGRLPFGCHGWAAIDRRFWEPHLL